MKTLLKCALHAGHNVRSRTLLSGLALTMLCAAAPALCHAEEPPPPKPPVQVTLNFKDTPLEAVIDQLSEMTGLVIVKDMALEGRITIISKQPMNVDEALQLLNSVLKEKNLVGLRTGRVLKLVKLDDAKKHNIPVHTGNDPEKIEPSDEVITQVIPIKFIDAQQLKKDFAPLVPGYADLSSNQGSNTLILTDTAANVRRIVEIIHAMDTQSTTVSDVKVFQLKYANATNAAKLISDIFKEDSGNAQNPAAQILRNQRAFFGAMRPGGGGPGGPGGGGGGGGTDSESQDGQRNRKVTTSADERTNTVVVSASPDIMKIIEQVIKELDANPAEEQSVFVYRCMNAKAANLESIINTLFGTGTPSRSSTTGATNNNNASRTTPTSSNAITGTTGRLPGTTAQPTQAFNPLQAGNQNTPAPAARPQGLVGDLTGQIYAVADLDTNSVMILTSPKNFERVKSILLNLDKPVPQVFIKVLIAEVTHDKGDDVGVDISVLTKGTVKEVLSDFGAATATGGLVSKIATSDLQATLHAIATTSKLDILSRPYILASDNQLSSITVGQEVPFIVDSRTTDTGETINTVQYQDIGIILNVTAHINEEGLVIMDVAPEVSSLTGQTVPIAANVSAPVFAKRSAQTRVGVKDGQTIVIGGLMQDQKTLTESGIPVLRRIPGLGTLFRHRTNDKSKTELLIFLTPHVAQDPGKLKPMSDVEKAALKIVPNAVAPGVFQDHMEGLDRMGHLDQPNASPAPEKPAAQPAEKPKEKGEVVPLPAK